MERELGAIDKNRGRGKGEGRAELRRKGLNKKDKKQEGKAGWRGGK